MNKFPLNMGLYVKISSTKSAKYSAKYPQVFSPSEHPMDILDKFQNFQNRHIFKICIFSKFLLALSLRPSNFRLLFYISNLIVIGMEAI